MRSALTFLITIALSSAIQADDTQQRIEKSKEVSKAFMIQLKGELETAIKEGGAIKAISVCNLKAPKIAQHHSESNNLTISRTSLKIRNPKNTPDSWEKNVLTSFETRKAKGEGLDAMAFTEITEENGQKHFRFMKAIPTGEVCLNCHGSNLDTAVTNKLDELYPNDQARGYKAGDIRGAFSIKQPM